MSLYNAKKLGSLAIAAVVLSLVAAQGCGGDDDTQAKPTAGAGGSTAGSGGKANGGSSGKSNGGTSGKTEEAGTGDTGDTAGDTGEGGMGGEGGGASCDGEDGCYSCTPTTNSQLLNHCVPGGCPATFDNSTLTKLNQVGTL